MGRLPLKCMEGIGFIGVGAPLVLFVVRREGRRQRLLTKLRKSYLQKMETDLFRNLKTIDDSLIAELVSRNSERVICSNCNRKQSTYCSFCELPLNHKSPKVNIPINVDIYRHWNEKPQNSTTVFCKLVAPEKTNIFEFQEVDTDEELQKLAERYPNPSRVVLLYPTSDSVSLNELDEGSFDTLAVIDGTWNQAKPMAKLFGKMGFKHVKISSHETMFWRFQSLNRTYLATIEAIYWFFVDYHCAFEQKSIPYDGRYDNLLFYFKLKYCVIQEYYRKRPGKPFTPRHTLSESFIDYE